MKTVVIYQSKYGFTKIYAKWIAEDLGAELAEAKQISISNLQEYNTIIYGGGLYAGGVSGLSLLTKNFERLKNKKLYVFTVGVADVTDPENIKGIRSSLSRVLTPAMLQVIKLYHLRGGMCYSKMGFIHRKMMGMMMKMIHKKPESELRVEEKMMLKNYGKDVDFTDRQSIAELVMQVKAAG